MRRAARSALVAALLAAVGGCGSTAASFSSTHSDPARASPAATLPAAAVPYLPSVLRRLTPSGLAREAGTPRLRVKLSTWGFLAGADRYFQGESRQLQVVDSRMLRFRTAGGANMFLAFIRAHAAVYLGSFPGTREFISRGRSGILATAQECQCHLANPAFLAVVTRGATVTWLEINGPGATSRRLLQLLAVAP